MWIKLFAYLQHTYYVCTYNTCQREETTAQVAGLSSDRLNKVSHTFVPGLHTQTGAKAGAATIWER